ncbi:MAG: hypothetical protein ABIH39_09060, partial [Candidatus Margulisiibacteriota bacterium]
MVGKQDGKVTMAENEIRQVFDGFNAAYAIPTFRPRIENIVEPGMIEKQGDKYKLSQKGIQTVVDEFKRRGNIQEIMADGYKMMPVSETELNNISALKGKLHLFFDQDPKDKTKLILKKNLPIKKLIKENIKDPNEQKAFRKVLQKAHGSNIVFQYMLDGETKDTMRQVEEAFSRSKGDLKNALVKELGLNKAKNITIEANPVKINRDILVIAKDYDPNKVFTGITTPKVNMKSFGEKIAREMGVTTDAFKLIMGRLVKPDIAMKGLNGRWVGNQFIPFSAAFSIKDYEAIGEMKDAKVSVAILKSVFSNKSEIQKELNNYKRLEKIADEMYSQRNNSSPSLAKVQTSDDARILTAILNNIDKNVIAGKDIHILTAAEARDPKIANQIIKTGGEKGHFLIVTAGGRGTDIVLAPEIREMKGLYVITQGRDAHARIDIQGQWRGARDGKTGEGQYVLTVEDQCFGKVSKEQLMKKLGVSKADMAKGSFTLDKGQCDKVLEIQKDNEAKQFQDVKKTVAQHEGLFNYLKAIDTVSLELGQAWGNYIMTGKEAARQVVSRIVIDRSSNLVLDSILAPYQGKPINRRMVIEIAEKIEKNTGVKVSVDDNVTGVTANDIKDQVQTAITKKINDIDQKTLLSMQEKLMQTVKDIKAKIISEYSQITDEAERINVKRSTKGKSSRNKIVAKKLAEKGYKIVDKMSDDLAKGIKKS